MGGETNRHWQHNHSLQLLWDRENGMKLFFICLGLLCQSTLLISQATAKEFRSADVHDKNYPVVQAVQWAANHIAKDTHGKIRINIHPNSALGSERDTVEQLRIGSLELTRVNSAALSKLVPESRVLSLPYLFRDETHYRKVIDGPIGAEILAAFSRAELIGLAFYDDGARCLYAKKPVRNLQDFKNMKVRVMQSDIWQDIMLALGATPVPLPTHDIRPAFRNGAVDAAENNLSTYESQLHYLDAPYFSETAHSYSPDVLIMSKKVWDTLNPQDQAIIRRYAQESVGFHRKLWDQRQAEARRNLLAHNVSIISDVDRIGLKNATKPLYNNLLKSSNLKNLVARIEAER